jgi:hypothetical protein
MIYRLDGSRLPGWGLQARLVEEAAEFLQRHRLLPSMIPNETGLPGRRHAPEPA